MDVFDLVATLSLDRSDYDRGLDESKEKGSSFLEKITKGFGTATKVAGAALVGFGTAAVGVTTALVNGASKTAQYGDNIDKMSQKLGISAEAYQEWDAILQHSGSSIDSMQRGMMTLASAAEKDSDAFQKLGISTEDVASMSQEDLFGAVIAGLQGMEEGSERAVLAQELLGGAAKELGPLLNTSAEDTEEMRKRVHELGGVMSNEAVKAAAAYQDSLQDLQTSFSSLGRGLFSEFMPSITTVMDGLTEIFSGNGDAGIEMISEGIDDLITGITEKLPEFLDLGLSILQSLLDAIIDNLPKLLGAAGEIVGKLIAGIISALPQLIAQAPAMIKAIVTGLAEAWPEIKTAGMELITMLIEGLSSLFDSLVTIGGNILGKIRDGITGAFEKIKEAGKMIVDKIKEGILEKWNSLVSWFTGIWDSLFGNRSVNVNVNKNGGSSHANGLDYVPFNNYPANLHKGEAVLTRSEAQEWRNGQKSNNVVFNLNAPSVDESVVDYIIQQANARLGAMA